MSRVKLHDETTAPDGARPFYAKGYPGPIPASLAQVPDLMQVALPFIGRTLGASTLGLRTKEIAILRASALLKCRYCTQTHTVVALDAGLGEPEVAALRGDGSIADAFTSAAERALIAWTDAVAVGPGAVDERLVAALRQHFKEPEIVELTMVIGVTIMLNRYATALDLPIAEGHLVRLAEVGLA